MLGTVVVVLALTVVLASTGFAATFDIELSPSRCTSTASTAASVRISRVRRTCSANEYVGHDEPSLLFYSNQAWFGQPDAVQHDASDRPSGLKSAKALLPVRAERRDVARDGSVRHPVLPGAGVDLHARQRLQHRRPGGVAQSSPGTAFLELQFYPPGWVPWPTWAVAVGASSCDPTSWCAAMNVFSVLEDPVDGTTQNSTCAARVGLEPFELRFRHHERCRRSAGQSARRDVGDVHAGQLA